MTHTPTPWKVTGYDHDNNGPIYSIEQEYPTNYEENAKFIELACNHHDDILDALKDAVDNYVAVVCNKDQVSLEQVKSDPVVKRWYDLIESIDAKLEKAKSVENKDS